MKIVLMQEKSDEIEVVIKGDCTSEEVKTVVEILQNVDLKKPSRMIIGKKNEKEYVLPVEDVECFYTIDGSLYANYAAGEYGIKSTLSDIEETYHGMGFRRISKSYVLNCGFLKYLEVEFSGNYMATTKSEDKLLISRKYISQVRQYIKEEM